MHSVAVMEFKIVREVWGERPNCKKRACDSKPKDPKEESEKESMAHSGKASPTLKIPEGIPRSRGGKWRKHGPKWPISMNFENIWA